MRRYRRPLITFVTVFLIAMSGAFAVGEASAGIVNGTPKTYTVNGITYKAAAEIATDTSTHRVMSLVGAIVMNKKAPTGSIGAYAKIYNSAGDAKCTSGWKYSDAPVAVGDSFVATCEKTFSGTYYSDGQTRAWTGSSYKTYDMNKSPNQNS